MENKQPIVRLNGKIKMKKNEGRNGINGQGNRGTSKVVRREHCPQL